MKVNVLAHPNSKKPRIEKDLLGLIHVWVSEPPFDGRANNEIINFLAKYFKAKRSNIILFKGKKSKYKIFEIINE